MVGTTCTKSNSYVWVGIVMIILPKNIALDENITINILEPDSPGIHSGSFVSTDDIRYPFDIVGPQSSVPDDAAVIAALASAVEYKAISIAK